MLLFSLALHPVILKVSENFPQITLNAWYADDGTLIFPRLIANDVLSFVKSEGEKVGFCLNVTKTNAWWLSAPTYAEIAASGTPDINPVLARFRPDRSNRQAAALFSVPDPGLASDSLGTTIQPQLPIWQYYVER